MTLACSFVIARYVDFASYVDDGWTTVVPFKCIGPTRFQVNTAETISDVFKIYLVSAGFKASKARRSVYHERSLEGSTRQTFG